MVVQEALANGVCSVLATALVMRPTSVIVAEPTKVKPKKNYLDLENAENVYVLW